MQIKFNSFFWILGCLLTISGNRLQAQCASATLNLSGFTAEGGQGTYNDPATGKISINYCLTLDRFFEANTNWVHGIFVSWENIPQGGVVSPGPTGVQATQHGNRFWIFLDSAAARLYNLPGPGYYVDEGDNNPRNNYGDNGLGTPQATFPDLDPFCFILKLDCAITPAQAYVPKLTITGDGTTGGWKNPACPGDVVRAYTGGPNGNGAIVVCGVILPVKLLHFSGDATDQGNQIRWIATADRYFSHFELERSSADQASFITLDRQEASSGQTGNGSEWVEYQYLDPEPPVTGLYRLKMLEKDGRFSYSQIISVRYGQPREIPDGLFIYPNPARDLLFLHHVDQLPYESIQTRIFDAMGRPFVSKTFILSRTLKVVIIDISELPVGLCFLDVYAGDTRISQQSFIKQ
ncbi:MAG TPA: T9SS type A sorting domain-containing protein [Saprospiraceae bacterium]|nr:T9SS type A sorting domain-containing protein [Saprospiraceae bacterium]